MIKLKRIFSCFLIALASLMLFACKGGKGKVYDLSKMKPKKTIVSFWFDDEKGEYVDEVIKLFEEQNPDISIKHHHIGSVESRDTIKLLGLSGGGPDIFAFPHDHLAPAVEEGLLAHLPEDFENNIKKTVSGSALEISKFKGSKDDSEKLYAIPSSIETPVLFYNKDLIEKLGEKEPVKTFEEAIENGVKFGEKTIEGTTDKYNTKNYQYLSLANHWADTYYMQMINTAFGFSMFGKDQNDNTAVGFETKEAKAAYKYYLENIVEKLSYGNVKGSSAEFEEGKVPYIIGGPWNYESFKEKLGEKLGITTIPTINGKPAGPYAGAQLMAITKFSKVQAEARKFLEFLSQPEAGLILYRKKGKVPALKTEIINENEELKNEDFVSAITKQLESAVFMPTIPEVQQMWGPSEALYRALFATGKDADIDKLTEDAEKSYRTLIGK